MSTPATLSVHGAEIPVMGFGTNQVECHPYLDQTRMLAALQRHGMVLTAHCPLAGAASY
jgi:2,5-diketo-D-gluconate reductase B